jgi:hypothetical protein
MSPCVSIHAPSSRSATVSASSWVTVASSAANARLVVRSRAGGCGIEAGPGRAIRAPSAAAISARWTARRNFSNFSTFQETHTDGKTRNRAKRFEELKSFFFSLFSLFFSLYLIELTTYTYPSGPKLFNEKLLKSLNSFALPPPLCTPSGRTCHARTPYSAPPGRESACSRKGATTAVVSLPVTTGTTSNVAPKPRH